tara:strand:+ start:471 stop:944 length:474 start_codon:yes stop_codon:yes gene_type:complete
MKKLGLIIIVTFLSSCDSAKVFEENIALENYIWSAENHLKFQMEITDTINEMNLFLNIRHTAHYPFSNLWIFVNTTTPEGIKTIDTLECKLAEKDGRWIGSGLGDIWDIQIPIKTNVFSNHGDYTFEIEQAMRYAEKARIEQLPEVMNIGFRIEKKE